MSKILRNDVWDIIYGRTMKLGTFLDGISEGTSSLSLVSLFGYLQVLFGIVFFHLISLGLPASVSLFYVLC